MLTHGGSNLILVCYTDFDFMSTFEYMFTIREATISWRSIKQQCIADSTTEAQYVVATKAAKEAI